MSNVTLSGLVPAPSFRHAPIALAIALSLAGCGGGGGSSGSGSGDGGGSGGDRTVDAGGERDGGGGASPPAGPPDVPVTSDGTVVLERRGDKLTADAWFVTSAPEAAILAPGGADDSPDHCSLNPVALDGAAGTARPSLAVGSGDDAAPSRATVAPAARLVATSRDGEYLALELERLGPSAVYATEANWIREPLPDDLSLAVHDADGAMLFDPVALRPVPDPVMLVPDDGRLDGLSGAVRWSAPGESDDTRVRLTLHGWRAVDGRIGEGEATTIHCLLADDGEFLVPGELRRAIGDVSGRWTARLARERRTRVSRDGSSLEIVQLVLPGN